uniref:Ig-like domain-containing protein n=1 Tax=Cairina moschata TaxID=8855 RepID=A0A8C3C3V4_CAIMO
MGVSRNKFLGMWGVKGGLGGLWAAPQGCGTCWGAVAVTEGHGSMGPAHSWNSRNDLRWHTGLRAKPQGHVPCPHACPQAPRQLTGATAFEANQSPKAFSKHPRSGQRPQALGDKGWGQTSQHSALLPIRGGFRPLGTQHRGSRVPLVPHSGAGAWVRGVRGDMGTPRLCLLVLAGLFRLAALEDKMTAWIQPYPPAPTMYHQLMLSCEVTGDASVKEFLWEKKGSREPLQKGQSNVLIISSFTESHLGTYTCTATGPLGTAVATYDLWINDLVNQVFVFPRETKDSYVVLRVKPEQPLLNFTVCLRSYTDLTRPHSLFSYATKAQDNEILLF